jgi:DNA-binding beta-propeller fold protein YncE
VDTRTGVARVVPEPYDLGGNEHPDIAAGTGVAWVTGAATSEGGVDRVPESDARGEPLHVPFGSASAVVVHGGYVWATSDPGSKKDGSIVRIDAKTGRVVARRTVERRAVDLAFAGGAVWVALQRTGAVVRLDPASLKELGRVQLGVGISRLAADGATLWVLNKANRTVSRIDARRATSVGVPVALGKELQDIAASRGSLWIAGSDRTLTRVGPDGAVIGTPIAVGAAPLSLAGDGADVWVASGSDNSLIRVSTR